MVLCQRLLAIAPLFAQQARLTERSYRQSRANSEADRSILAALVQRRSANSPQGEQAQPPTQVHDFSQVNLFAHDPGPRSVPNILQAKLTVGAPNDQYEQEADHVAQQVVQPAHELQMKP